MRDDVARIVGPILDPALAELAEGLAEVAALSAVERDAVRGGLTQSVREVVWRYVSRTVVLELHIARRAGRLTAAGTRARWQEWVDQLARPAGWAELAVPYPALRPRLTTLTRNRCAAALRLARRLGADRAMLAALPGGHLGELTDVVFGAGDSHSGGQSTTVLRGSTGRLVYKPRSLAVDAVLGTLLARLLPGEPATTRIRVPAALPRHDADGVYGWAEHVAHRYCRDEVELAAFYRGLGHWLAVLGLLAGTDLHAENLVAAGPVPVVVDCETLFALPAPVTASGYGEAADRAADLLGRSVLATGLLPARGVGLGARGVDMSAAGALPGQQPVRDVPGLVDQGTDRVRMGLVELRQPARRNLPAPEPDPTRYWDQVADGYLALTEHLRQLDRDGRLERWLAGFAGCPVRIVPRDTGGYDEIGHMLWHPSSLHRPELAVQRARELLARQAENRPDAPSDPEVIAAEVAELLDGDIPVFTTVPRSGVRTGPRGIRRGRPVDLVAAALTRWRSADPVLDCRIIRSTVVSAYLGDSPELPLPPPAPVRTGQGDDLEPRRRALAATMIGQLATEAIRGEDRTATWVAPVYGPTGASLRPLPPDLYGGLIGVAVALAGYQVELAAGRADPVPGAAALLSGTLATLRLAEDRQAADLAKAHVAGIVIRPESPGGYTGLGSRIWGWLLLHRQGAVDAAEAEQRAAMLAARLTRSIAADETYDLLAGCAGAIVPLLALAAFTGDDRWQAMAHTAAGRLRTAATVHGTGARWPTGQFPQGLGGLAHGAAGIGWALARLAATAPDPSGWRALADAAFQWQETLYQPNRPGWQDLRQPSQVSFTEAWCHGAVGIGLIAADLLHVDPDPRWPELMTRAATVIRLTGLGHGPSLCHGSLGAWELLDAAARAGLAPPGAAPHRLAAGILTSLESHGPVTGIAGGVVQPGLLLGVSGVAYQLLRLHPDCALPSVLLPDPGAVGPPGSGASSAGRLGDTA